MLIIICGLPGSGKTTISKELVRSLGAVHISSDAVRKDILSRPGYSDEEKALVYEELGKRVRESLASGRDVIADATFYRKEQRGMMEKIARAAGTRFHVIVCSLGEREVERRLSFRKPGGMSDADFNVHLKVKEVFEPVTGRKLELDCSLPMKRQIKLVRGFIGAGQARMTEGGIMDSGMLRGFAADSNFDFVETHISWVLIGEKYVYKIKRPVKFSFLDFSTLGKRRFFCNEEVRLNRRLTKDIYLGVSCIYQDQDASDGGRVRLTIKDAKEPGAEPCEYAVKMKKLDQEKMMNRMLVSGRVRPDDVLELAGIIADFHSKAEKAKDDYGSPEIVWRQIADLGSFQDAIEQACGMGKQVDEVLASSKRFIDKNEQLLRKRAEQGMVKDCHGDLHSGNIFLDGGVVITDCIEFNRDFRCIDVASDIAFMAMDLDAHGREDLSALFVGSYLDRTRDHGAAAPSSRSPIAKSVRVPCSSSRGETPTRLFPARLGSRSSQTSQCEYFSNEPGSSKNLIGLQDPELKTLLAFYKCYRANVRAKVAAIEWMENKGEEAAGRIRKYMALAHKYSEIL